MEFSLDHISFANLFQDGHNFIAFSVMGMLIVFVGLSFISIYITLLPKLLNLQQRLKEGERGKKEEAGPETDAAKKMELLLAIAVALHLDQASGSDSERITWKRYDDRDSPWVTAGRMRSLAGRSHLPDCRN